MIIYIFCRQLEVPVCDCGRVGVTEGGGGLFVEEGAGHEEGGGDMC